MFLVVLLTLFIHFFKCCCFENVFFFIFTGILLKIQSLFFINRMLFTVFLSSYFFFFLHLLLLLMIVVARRHYTRITETGNRTQAVTIAGVQKSFGTINSEMQWKSQGEKSTVSQKFANEPERVRERESKIEREAKRHWEKFIFFSANHINISGKNQMQNCAPRLTHVHTIYLHGNRMQIGLFNIHYSVYIFHSLASFRGQISVLFILFELIV